MTCLVLAGGNLLLKCQRVSKNDSFFHSWKRKAIIEICSFKIGTKHSKLVEPMAFSHALSVQCRAMSWGHACVVRPWSVKCVSQKLFVDWG